jgi:hypothetical protein
MSLFHWTDKESLLKILQDGRIYSKGTLWGLKKLSNTFPNIKKTVYQDAENGFIDFVFLGTKNWIAEGRNSFYGGFAIEFSSRLLLEDTEFFVFHSNTGYKWFRMAEKEKTSDLSKLISLPGLNGEILIRRNVDIDARTVLRIHCPEHERGAIEKAVQELDLSGSVESYPQLSHNRNSSENSWNIMQQYEVELEYGAFTNHVRQKIDSEYIQVKDDLVYVFDKDSPCVIDLKKDGERLLDTIDNKEVGSITIKHLIAG